MHTYCLVAGIAQCFFISGKLVLLKRLINTLERTKEKALWDPACRRFPQAEEGCAQDTMLQSQPGAWKCLQAAGVQLIAKAATPQPLKAAN